MLPTDRPTHYRDLDDWIIDEMTGKKPWDRRKPPDDGRASAWDRALGLAGDVRRQADERGYARPGTLLWEVSKYPVTADGSKGADCGTYAEALFRLLPSIYPAGHFRKVFIDFTVAKSPEHVYCEVLEGSRFRGLDPTFGLITRDEGGTPLSAADISLRLHAGTAAGLTHSYLTEWGDGLVKKYAIPYFLCHLTVTVGDPHLRPPILTAPSPWPKWCRVVTPPTDGTLFDRRVLGLRRDDPSSFSFALDSHSASMACNLAAGLCPVFAASRLSGLPADVVIWEPSLGGP